MKGSSPTKAPGSRTAGRARRRGQFLSGALLPIFLLSAAACGDDDPTAPEPSGDLAEVAAAEPQLTTLVDVLTAAGLVDDLQGDGPFTVFAPVNSAFAALDSDVLDGITGNADLLAEVLTYHVVAGVAARSSDLSDGQTVTTLEGGTLTIGVSGSSVTVNGVNVVTADVEADNGVVHLIDGVLFPQVDIVETAIITPETQTLAAAVAAGDLTTTLQGPGPFTVFAPVDAAFEALGTDKLDVLLDPANIDLLQKILTYHVIADDVRAGDLSDGLTAATVEGTEVTFDLTDPADPKVNGVSIIATDIEVENGVIHLIDGVLTDNADLVDVALLNGFPTLVDLAVEAGLEATLRDGNGGDGWTVFAPTEAAFGALSAVPTGAELVTVLTYHVVSGTVGSGDLSDGQVVTTVEGSTFTVNISGSDVTITDGAGSTVNVVVTDVPAANGVVHVIDGVILPS